MDEQTKNQFEDIKRKLDQLDSNIGSVRRALNKFESDYLKTDYTQIEGVTGKFDGYSMVSENGERFAVPENYAAKSKLVYGDTLKMIEENGKQLFKQVQRVNRKRVDGILTKKEGEWFLLTDRGSYKTSDVAAEFQNAQLNIQTTALLPVDNLDAPFATIDVVEGFRTKRRESKEEGVEEKREMRAEPKATANPKPLKAAAPKKAKPREQTKKLEKKEEPVQKKPEKKIASAKEKPPVKNYRKTSGTPPAPKKKSIGREKEEKETKTTKVNIEEDDLI